MIQKFQQGGQQDAIMQFVQGLAQTLQADPQQIVQAAQQNPKALEAAVQTYQQTQDMNQAAQVFTQAIQQQVQAARHGAKLQYLKSLKNQCPEGEELYYYKKGGSVGCGCKKKEDGGEVEKAQKGTVVKKFKNDYSSKRVKDSERDYFNGTADHTKPGVKKPTNKSVQKFKTRTKAEQDRIDKLSEEDYFNGYADHTKPGIKKVSKKACGSKIKKDCNGAVAKFKAACGSKLNKK